MSAPEPGASYTYTGNQLGSNDGPNYGLAIQSGTVVKVREVVPADQPGAHDDTEDAVVVETDEGRAWSVSLDTFAADYKEN